MKFVFAILFANLPPLACAVGAVILALHGIAGWGWFLLVTVLLGQSVKLGD